MGSLVTKLSLWQPPLRGQALPFPLPNSTQEREPRPDTPLTCTRLKSASPGSAEVAPHSVSSIDPLLMSRRTTARLTTSSPFLRVMVCSRHREKGRRGRFKRHYIGVVSNNSSLQICCHTPYNASEPFLLRLLLPPWVPRCSERSR